MIDKFNEIIMQTHERVALKKAGLKFKQHLFAARVFRDSLGPFRHSVLSQLSGEEESNSGLDFSARDGGALVVVSQTRCF